MAVISNNLANVNTTGFKRDRAGVRGPDLSRTSARGGANSTEDTTLPSGLYLGTGVRTVAAQKLHTQGNIVQTNNSFRHRGSGQWWVQITHRTAASCTRATVLRSRFDRSAGDAERLPARAGDHGAGQHAERHGRLRRHGVGDGRRQQRPTQIGNITVAQFVNPTGLEAIGDNLYRESAASGAPQTDTLGPTVPAR